MQNISKCRKLNYDTKYYDFIRFFVNRNAGNTKTIMNELKMINESIWE
jgi:hypothetical protein